SHRLAEIDCLSPRQRHFILAESAGARRLEILTGHDGRNARDRARGVEPVAANPRMRVRAAQYRAVQHAGPVKVIDILRLAGGLFACMEATKTGPDAGRNGFHAALAATMSATACTIF